MTLSLAQRLRAARLMPVVELPAVEQAVPLAEALLGAGLDCIEITFRTEAAAPALALLRERFPELLLGAGTVLTSEQLDVAVAAGVDFVVAPGFAPALVERCLERDVAVLPGVCTPSDIAQALAYGIDLVKFFPAEAMGGVATLRALAAPYRGVEFVPTGGIDPGRVPEYLAFPAVVACGGSWMVKPQLLADGDFDRVGELAAEAHRLVTERANPEVA
jgi:2-dehydro-3-deoxyphosphogluconate aldolase/(4S)-4-hydroxy-2-oxoglutarate aldolase